MQLWISNDAAKSSFHPNPFFWLVGILPWRSGCITSKIWQIKRIHFVPLFLISILSTSCEIDQLTWIKPLQGLQIDGGSGTRLQAVTGVLVGALIETRLTQNISFHGVLSAVFRSKRRSSSGCSLPTWNQKYPFCSHLTLPCVFTRNAEFL